MNRLPLIRKNILFKRPIRHVTLIEVLIALVLTVGILMTLMFFYRQVTEIGIESDRIEVKNFNMRYIETRLGSILTKAVGEKENDFIFFSLGDEGIAKPGSQGLIFTFENGISLDKPFSGHVLGRLLLDNKGNVVLAYWPSPKRWKSGENPPIKKEILFQGAENLTFEFYIAPASKTHQNSHPEKKTDSEEKKSNAEEKPDKTNSSKPKESTATEPEPKGAWRDQPWLQEYNQLPVMIKIIVGMPKQQDSYVFIFPLTNAKHHIVYE